MIYLDSAATTLQKPAAVAAASAWSIGHLASPGRGGHRPAMAAASTAYDCREAAARLFRVDDPAKVVFTFNATHGLNIAIKTLAGPGSRVVVSGYEHNAVTRPLSAMGVSLRVARGRSAGSWTGGWIWRYAPMCPMFLALSCPLRKSRRCAGNGRSR